MRKPKSKYVDALDWLNTKSKSDDDPRSLAPFFDNPKAAKEFVLEIKEAGGNVEVQGNSEHSDFCEEYASVIYITMPQQIGRVLFLLVAGLNPDEFDEVEKNKYRYWWV